LGVVIFELDLNTIVRLQIDLSFVLLIIALCANKSRKGTAILKYGLNGKWICSCFYFKLRLGDYKKNKLNINSLINCYPVWFLSKKNNYIKILKKTETSLNQPVSVWFVFRQKLVQISLV